MTTYTRAIRTPALLLVMCVLLLSGLGCSAGRSKAPADTTDGAQVRIYEVFGMDCPGCHGGVEKLVNELRAVEKSEANWKEKRLVVVVKPGSELKDEDVFDAIRRANFTPGDRLQ